MAAYCTQQNELEDAKFLVQCMKKTPDTKVSGDPGEVSKTHVSWRNTFTVINLMRVLQKLTKRKPRRISVLIQYKAPGILKRVVKLPHGSIAYYALKLLKSQLPYLGRKWQNGLNFYFIFYVSTRRHPFLWLLPSRKYEDRELYHV